MATWGSFFEKKIAYDVNIRQSNKSITHLKLECTPNAVNAANQAGSKVKQRIIGQGIDRPLQFKKFYSPNLVSVVSIFQR